MRRAVVTPTRVLLFPEAIETSNRVLRAWPAEMNAGRFIRVGFADEDGRLEINRRVTTAVVGVHCVSCIISCLTFAGSV